MQSYPASWMLLFSSTSSLKIVPKRIPISTLERKKGPKRNFFNPLHKGKVKINLCSLNNHKKGVKQRHFLQFQMSAWEKERHFYDFRFPALDRKQWPKNTGKGLPRLPEVQAQVPHQVPHQEDPQLPPLLPIVMSKHSLASPHPAAPRWPRMTPGWPRMTPSRTDWLTE